MCIRVLRAVRPVRLKQSESAVNTLSRKIRAWSPFKGAAGWRRVAGRVVGIRLRLLDDV